MSIIDDTKKIMELIKKYNDAELYQKIVDLRDEIFELKEENLNLKEKIKNLVEEKKVSEKMFFEAPFYWKMDGDKKDGPYCQKCYDDDKKLIRLQALEKEYWQCCVCKNYFRDPSYSRPKRPPTPGSWMST